MRNSCTSTLFLLPLLTFFNFATIRPIDNHHFYRASNFFYIFNETRLTKPGLTSFDATISYGSTQHARTNCKNNCKKNHTVALKKIYEQNNIYVCPPDNATNYHTNIFSSCDTDQDRFSLTEANFFYTKNFCHGFFVQTHCPLRHMILRLNSCYKKLTTTNDTSSNFCTESTPTNKTGWGDLSLLAGWTYSYTNTEYIDFIDTTCSLGILLPTGAQKSNGNPFDIPLGYNGHIGVPISYNCALGALEWITIGVHIGALFFFDAPEKIAMQLDSLCINLQQKKCLTARVHHGMIWDIATYFKADHIIKGLSLLFGYTFVQQQPNRIATHNRPATITTHYGSTHSLWNMHTIHFIAEYDFTPYNSTFGPRVGFMYNKQCGGKRIFKTNMKGGTCGLEICLHF